MSVEVKIRKGETVEKAMRRLRKKLLRETILQDARDRRYFVPPSQVRQKKKKEQAFNDMLRRRREDR